MLICIPAHVVHVIPIKENVKRIQRYTQNIPALAKGMKVSVLFERESQQRKIDCNISIKWSYIRP